MICARHAPRCLAERRTGSLLRVFDVSADGRHLGAELYHLDEDGSQAGRLSDDGATYVLAQLAPSRLHVVDLATGRDHVVVPARALDVQMTADLPGSRNLLFTGIQGATYVLGILEPSGEWRSLTTTPGWLSRPAVGPHDRIAVTQLLATSEITMLEPAAPR